MEWVSGLIILVMFVGLTLAIQKIDEKTEEESKRLDAEFKELQKQYYALLERCKDLGYDLNCENRKEQKDRK